MKVIADLEVHSRFARAVSPQMTIPNIARWSDKKGIDLIGTGDFTHPMWFKEISENLKEVENGIFGLKDNSSKSRFMLTSEVSCIYKHKDKLRRIHLLVYLSSFENVKKFNQELIKKGCNIIADGRPILGLPVKEVLRLALEVDERALVIPAHAWTPWFGYYGHFGGYDSLIDGFEDLSKYIYAIETGLSSDPAMNWKIEELENRRLVSFGDAHSLPKLGREATIFNVPKITFENIFNVISGKTLGIDKTIEFYPEEGKYHYSGHAKCKVVRSPNEIKKEGKICPVCGRELTIGVATRAADLSSSLTLQTTSEVDTFGVRWIKKSDDSKPPYAMLVPLQEIISETLSVGVGSKKVITMYEDMITKLGSEFKILLETDINIIKAEFGEKQASAISKVRKGDILVEPGYDGIFGKVAIDQQ